MDVFPSQEQNQNKVDISSTKPRIQSNNGISSEKSYTLLHEINAAIDDANTRVKYAHRESFPELMQKHENETKELSDNKKEEWWYRSNIEYYLYNLGVPVVLTHTMDNWSENDHQVVSWHWLQQRIDEPILARNLDQFRDIEGYTLARYVNTLLDHAKQKERFPVYAKDIALPESWKDVLSRRLPAYLQYRDRWHDLLADVDRQGNSQADPHVAGGITTVMMYIGSEATYTPLHWDVGGTMGHNIMVRAEDDGAAVWLCMPSASIESVAAFCRRVDPDTSLDADTATLSVQDLLYQTEFDVHVIVQRPGDLVLVPPLCTHQVINVNGPTVKVAWNTLPLRYTAPALKAVGRARTVGKHPVCRAKSAIYHGLRRRIAEINAAETRREVDGVPDVEMLLPLWKTVCQIVREEWVPAVDTWGTGEVHRYPDTTAHTRQCDACRADIFNRAFHCDVCGNKDDAGYGFDLCLLCVAQGRGCQHMEHMQLFQFMPLHRCVDLLFRQFPAAGARLIMLRGGTESQAVAFRQNDLSLPLWPPHRPLPWAAIAWHRIHAVAATLVYSCSWCRTEHFMRSMVQCSRCGSRVCEACLWHGWGQPLAQTLRCAGAWVCLPCVEEEEKEGRAVKDAGRKGGACLGGTGETIPMTMTMVGDGDGDGTREDVGMEMDRNTTDPMNADPAAMAINGKEGPDPDPGSRRGLCTRYVVPMHVDTQPGVTDQDRQTDHHHRRPGFKGTDTSSEGSKEKGKEKEKEEKEEKEGGTPPHTNTNTNTNTNTTTTMTEDSNTVESHEHVWRQAQHQIRVLKKRVRRRRSHHNNNNNNLRGNHPRRRRGRPRKQIS